MVEIRDLGLVSGAGGFYPFHDIHLPPGLRIPQMKVELERRRDVEMNLLSLTRCTSPS